MKRQHARHVRLIPYLIFVFSFVLPFTYPISLAKAAGPSTSITGNTVTGNFSTQVVLPPAGGKVYGIQGGQTVESNLFHSFGQFNVGAGDTAQFQTTNLSQNAAISNILGRITGQTSASQIFGTIDSATFYPAANLFLMNPYGFLFGPTATVNVGGMVAFTSADYLRLEGPGGSGTFYADPAKGSILTSSPVAAFGFLGSNPGAITVQGSQLSVTPGQSLSLVGGNITVQSGVLDDGVTVQPARLTAPGGRINIASVAGPGEISAADFMPTPGMTMGNISLSQGALLDVSADAAGTVRIRGGQLVIAEGAISADTVNTNGAPTAVDIQLTGDFSIANDFNPAITARTTGSGDTGRVSIAAANLTASSNTLGLLTLIDTHTEGTGKGGDVSISTGNLLMTGSMQGFSTFIDSGTQGAGNGGNVTINAQNVQIDTSLITTGNFWANNFGVDATGSAGNVSISTGSLNLTFSQITTDAFSFANGTGRSGDISLTAHDINLVFTPISASGHQGSGTIAINTDNLFATASNIVTQSNLTSGGSITVTGKAIDLTNGSSIASSTGGNGNAGSITITATDHLGLLADTGSDPSGLFSNSFGAFGTQGNSGNVVVTTPRLEMTGGSRINTTTATSGHGGNVTINTTGPITMSGETAFFPPEPLFALGVAQPSGIYTRTIGGNCSGPCGNAGSISINTGSLTMGTGSQINTGTSSSGQGGNITISAANTIEMSGTLSTGQPGGIQSRSTGADPDAGAGGNISLTAGQSLKISNGAAVSASSEGPGPTGNINISAGNQFAMTNSTVTTEALQSSGGTIKITTNPDGTVQLTDSTISASVLNGAGGGGSVNIDPQYVILHNSQIIAKAVDGPGGNIFITTNLLLPDANSTISASSQFGQQGTVTIQSPASPASGRINPLGQKPLIATSLVSQRCAALAAGNTSSFTVAGRDTLPAEPGGWLSSPLALGNVEFDGRPVAETATTEASEETPILSLRRIAPPGFLIQSFATNSSTGCAS